MNLSNESLNALKLTEKENRFTQPWKNSDVVLVVEDKELHVHSITLSMVSPVFEAMFNGNFKEAQTKRVVLEGKPYDTFLYMLRMIYPFEDVFLEDEILFCGGCSEMKGQERDYTKAQRFGYCYSCSNGIQNMETRMVTFFKQLRGLYSLSNEYMIDTIVEKINREISRQSKKMYNSSHALHLLETAEITGSEDLKTACHTYIDRYLSSATEMNKLLEGRILSLKTEMKMKGQLFKNLVNRMVASNNVNSRQAFGNELNELGVNFISLALKEEN